MASAQDLPRNVLPIPDREHQGLTTFDAKDPDTHYPPIQPLRPPAGAPNVLVVLLDDVGFGASSAFGGPVHTPTAERLAAQGLKYNRFHTTALCSPTRAALLTGRNHHSKVGEGRIEQTEPFVFSADETLDIGFESGSSVTTDYSSNRFNGEVNWVQNDVGDDANDLDHFLNHQERLKIAMALH